MHRETHLPKKSTPVFAVIAGIASLLALADWQLDIQSLYQPFPELAGMNPVTATCFTFLSVALWLLTQRRDSKTTYAVRALSLLVLFTGVAKITLAFAGNADLPPASMTDMMNRMSLAAAVNLILLGLALFAISWRNNACRQIANYAAFMVLIAGIFSISGYIFRVKELYGLHGGVPIAAPAAICFILTALSLLFYNRYIGFMRAFTSASSGGVMARMLIPCVILIPIVIGYFRLWFFWKFPFTVELGTTIFIISMIIIFLLLIWRLAGLLNKAEDGRKQAEETLRELNRQLEYKVTERTREALHHERRLRAVLESNVTEKKESEEKLKKSEFRLKEAQAIACMGNWEVNLETEESVWSDEIYNLYGIDPGECQPTSESFLSFIHPDDVASITRKMYFNSPLPADECFTFRFIRKDGTIRHGLSQWKFEFNSEGKPVRIYGILQDITERKIREEERSRIMDDLVQRNKDHEQFAYIVSHNLRAPVANMLGFSEALLCQELSGETKAKFSEGLFESSQKLDAIIKDLTHILQVRREVSELKQPVSLHALVEDVRFSISNMIEKEKAQIRCRFDVAEITAIKTYLHSIFYNLISNSIKYRNPALAPAIEIESRRSGNNVELVFRDNGLGIDLEQKGEQVFGLYKRFHPQIEGRGVGLFMTRTQVETMGGRITVNSEVNKGTEFKIEFVV